MGEKENEREEFIHAIRKFMEMRTLTKQVLNELIDRIDVYETQGTGKNKTQRLVIYYKFVGYLDIDPTQCRPNYTADIREGVAIAHNPADGCALPKAEHKEMQTLPIEQLTSFLREAKDSGVFALYYIDLTTGLRRGELLGLKWSDIDLEKGDLRVQRQIGRIDGKIIEMPLKTKNAYRTLPLSADAIDVLMQQRRKTGNSEWVFPSPTGGPMSPDSVLHMLHRVLKRAGLPKVRFHDLRHTFATLALQNGVDIKTVSGMLGHFSAGFTLDTYAHVTTSAKREAAKTMGNLLSGAV